MTRVRRGARRRISKNARLIAERVLAPACQTFRQLLAGSVYSKSRSGTAQLYGARNTTSGNRIGMRLLCNLSDPRLIYAAAEQFNLNANDSTHLRIFKMTTKVTLMNRGALPVHVEFNRLMERVGSEYTTSASTGTFSIDGASDYVVPGWDNPTLFYMEGVYSELASYTTALKVGRSIFELSDFCSEYKVLRQSKFKIGPGKSRSFYFTRRQHQTIDLSRWYLSTVATANRLWDHHKGDELIWVRTHGSIGGDLTNTGGGPDMGYAPHELLFSVEQNLCCSKATGEFQKTFDVTSTTGMINGYNIGTVPFSASGFTGVYSGNPDFEAGIPVDIDRLTAVI